MKKFSKLAAILAVCAFIFGGLLVSCSPHGTGYGLDDVQPSGGGAGGAGGGSGGDGGGSGGTGGGSGGGEPAPTPAAWDGDLSKLTAQSTAAFATATDGMTITGTLASNVKISIADGATVTLKDVTINGTDSDSYKWAGLTCAGDATITLEGANTVKGFWKYYPGLFVPKGKTLTIKGSGSLNASNEKAAGIGGCCVDVTSGIQKEQGSCGTIVIEGGTITATGGANAAGIGCGNGSDCDGVTIKGGTVTATGGTTAAGIGSAQTESSCGDILISGGTVTATGGDYAAGVGTGRGDNSRCGAITVATTVTKFKATKAGYATNSVGRARDGSSVCGTVTVGNQAYPDGISASPYVYPQPPAGGIDGLFSVSATKKVYFSKGNLRATYDGSSWTWSFADHQYDAVGNAAANTSITGDGTVSDNGSVDLFGWVGANSAFEGMAAFGISDSVYGDYGYDAGEALKSDWGTNAISNGGNVANYGWRTLTKDEWKYVFKTRTDADSKNGAATVSGVAGWILLPDAWTLPAGGARFTAGAASGYTTNSYTAEQWAVLENAGAVFLPVTGTRHGSTVEYWTEYGYYWSATSSSDAKAYRVTFIPSAYSFSDLSRSNACSAVRLAKDSE